MRHVARVAIEQLRLLEAVRNLNSDSQRDTGRLRFLGLEFQPGKHQFLSAGTEGDAQENAEAHHKPRYEIRPAQAGNALIKGKKRGGHSTGVIQQHYPQGKDWRLDQGGASR